MSTRRKQDLGVNPEGCGHSSSSPPPHPPRPPTLRAGHGHPPLTDPSLRSLGPSGARPLGPQEQWTPPPQGPEASGISNRVFVALCPLCPWPLPPPSSAEGLVVPPPTSPCPGKMRSTFGVSPGIALGWDFTPKLGAKARPAGVGPEQGHRTAAGSRAHLHLFPAPHPSCD